MRHSPTGLEIAAVAMGCAAACGLAANPASLPGPCELGLRRAADGVSRGFLWLWDEPEQGWFAPGERWQLEPAAGPDRWTGGRMLPRGDGPRADAGDVSLLSM